MLWQDAGGRSRRSPVILAVTARPSVGTCRGSVRASAAPDPLAPFAAYLAARFADDPHLWASALFDEVVPLGYHLSYVSFARQTPGTGRRACRGPRPTATASRAPAWLGARSSDADTPGTYHQPGAGLGQSPPSTSWTAAARLITQRPHHNKRSACRRWRQAEADLPGECASMATCWWSAAAEARCAVRMFLVTVAVAGPSRD